MSIALTYDEVKALRPCADRFRRVVKLLGGKEGWNGNRISAAEARAAGCTFDDIVWIASAAATTNADVERRLRLWMADCAAHVLHIYEKTEASDAPRKAIIAARQFARGEIDDAARDAAWDASAAARDARIAAWDAASAAAWAAWVAARDAAWDARIAAWDAASAAAWAAWVAARDAAWVAASAAARDARIAAWAAWVAARDAAWDARAAASADEEAWQFDRLIARLSDDEPEDVPPPERKNVMEGTAAVPGGMP
jgi:hypothetical protein